MNIYTKFLFTLPNIAVQVIIEERNPSSNISRKTIMIESQDIFTKHHQEQLAKLIDDKKLRENSFFFTLRHSKFANKKGSNILLPYSDSEFYPNWTHFKSFLNRKLFGNRFRQQKKFFEHLTVQHDHISKPYLTHIHSIIVKPLSLASNIFHDLVLSCWQKTLFGFLGRREKNTNKYCMVNIQSIYSNGCIKYQFQDQPHYSSISVV